MKRLAFLLVLTPAIAFADKMIVDNNVTMTIDCGKDPSTQLNGNEGTFTFTGKCTAIQINGNHNTVTAESVKKLQVNGNDNTASAGAVDAIATNGSNNTVSYGKGISKAKPKTSNPGKGNTIKQGDAGAAAPAGDKDKPADSKPAPKSGGIDCNKNPKQSINEGDTVATYTGTCESIAVNSGGNKLTIENVKILTLNGGDNTVTAGGIDLLTMNGSNNKVSYKKGVSGAKPKITSNGDGNKAEQTK